MYQHDGQIWNIGKYTFEQYRDYETGEIAFTYAIEGGGGKNHFYASLEDAMAEAIAEKITGTRPHAFGPGTGSAAKWFIAACKGAKA